MSTVHYPYSYQTAIGALPLDFGLDPVRYGQRLGTEEVMGNRVLQYRDVACYSAKGGYRVSESGLISVEVVERLWRSLR